VVATPNSTHFELAQRCLHAGRDVVVDKPFTVTSGEARQLIELAKDQKRLLTVYQNRRWDGDFLTVQKLIASSILGRITRYESHFDRFRPALKPRAWREDPEAGGGALLDIGAHLLDQALTQFGRPEAITADVFTERDDSRVEDAFNLRLAYPQLRVLLSSSVLACAPGPRFLLYGARGSFVKYGVESQEGRLRQGEVPSLAKRWGEEPESQWGSLYLEQRAGSLEIEQKKLPTEAGDYRRFYENLRDTIEAGAPLAVRPEEALWTMRAIEMARQSSVTRRTVSWDESDADANDFLAGGTIPGDESEF
jgi:scyllo-inositol 2-dehydrogenase (NADP+)